MDYKLINPPQSIAAFVESFWMLHNPSDENKEVIVLPDGRIDLFFSVSTTEPFHITLLGLETQPSYATIEPQTLTFAISFKPLAAEYLLQQTVSDLLDTAIRLPAGFWDFNAGDLNSFEHFCQKAVHTIQERIPENIDERKIKLFDLMFASNGALSVKEFSEKVYWSSRQINRYFNKQYGISLKTYCNILRFRASFDHIKKGKLFPEQDFFDQPHFIRTVKKLTGVSPKELRHNQNDRFIQFSTLTGK